MLTSLDWKRRELVEEECCEFSGLVKKEVTRQDGVNCEEESMNKEN